VPKAYVSLAARAAPGPEPARDIMAFCRERLASCKRIRRIDFAASPSKISGKIRRIELRARAADESIAKPRGTTEFWEGEGDFTEEPACYLMATNQSRPGDI